jgi:hypothetical protein
MVNFLLFDFHYQKLLSADGKFQLSIIGNFCLLAHSQEISQKVKGDFRAE